MVVSEVAVFLPNPILPCFAEIAGNLATPSVQAAKEEKIPHFTTVEDRELLAVLREMPAVDAVEWE